MVAAAALVLASCEDKNRVDVKKDAAALPFTLPASMKLETIVANDFVKHRNYAAQAMKRQGLTCTVKFTYPTEYSDIDVLRTLQRKFLAYGLSEEAAAALPDHFTAPAEASDVKPTLWQRLFGKKAAAPTIATTNSLLSDWIKEYIRGLLAEWNKEFQAINSKDNPVESWLRERHADVLFANDALLQLRVWHLDNTGAEQGSTTVSVHLFDLATAKEFSQADIFNADSAEKIRDLVIPGLLEYWNVVRELVTDTKATWERTASLQELQTILKDYKKHKTAKAPRTREIPLPELDAEGNVPFNKDAVWTPSTSFAIAPEGIVVLYSEGELGSRTLGSPEITIPFAAILPHLREGTPVHDLAKTRGVVISH